MLMAPNIRSHLVADYRLIRCSIYFFLFAIVFLSVTLRVARADETIWTSINGQELYQKYCASCHGADGNPPKDITYALAPKPLPLTAPKLLYATSRAELESVIANGTASTMIGFRQLLSSEQISAIAQYIMEIRKGLPLSGGKTHSALDESSQ